MEDKIYIIIFLFWQRVATQAVTRISGEYSLLVFSVGSPEDGGRCFVRNVDITYDISFVIPEGRNLHIEIHFTEMGYQNCDWIYVAEAIDQWRVTNLLVPSEMNEFLTRCWFLFSPEVVSFMECLGMNNEGVEAVTRDDGVEY
jgi:hypothetical protein